jgi:GT2 family glycosyltransferase
MAQTIAGVLVQDSSILPVSVVIACHTEDRWDSLVGSIDSALEQRPRPAEVIVAVDHNSRLLERVSIRFPSVTVVQSGRASGASGARNAGTARALTSYVAFLDDDAFAQPGWLQKLLEPFADPLVVGTGGRVEPAWQTPRPRWFPDEFAWVVGASYTGLPETVAPVRNVWSENMAVRRDAFDSVGGFREHFGKLGDTSTPEDTDLCIRLGASVPGGRWMYVPEAVVHHHVPAGRSTFRFFLRRSFWEGRGKVEMSRHLKSERNLQLENRYLRETVPRGLARNLRAAAAGRDGAKALAAGAILAGTAAAGAGAAAGLIAGRSTAGVNR